MTTSRLEAFSDGVLAIIITIMVLELPIPHSGEFSALLAVWPKFLAYLLSFAFLGIYWNNHHHLLKVAPHVDARIMWANLHLLFWLSMIPFSTAWLGDHYRDAWPTAFYGFITLLSAMAYTLLQAAIVRHQHDSDELKKRLGKDWKGKVSLIFYLSSIVFAFILPVISDLLFATVAIMWLVPDKRLVEGAH